MRAERKRTKNRTLGDTPDNSTDGGFVFQKKNKLLFVIEELNQRRVSIVSDANI